MKDGAHVSVNTDVKCVCAAPNLLKGSRNVLSSPDFECRHFNAGRTCRCLDFVHFQHGSGVADIGHDGQPAEPQNKLAQKLQVLAGKLSVLH